MLITINVVPMLIYFLVLASLIDRYGTSDWGRIYTFACATLATFLSTFVIVLNNHLIAAVAIAIATYAVVRIYVEQDMRLRWFLLAGLSAAFAAASELPALSFTALVGAMLLWRSPRPTLLAFVPAALLIAAAAVGTNYAAWGTWEPAYKHKEWYQYTYVKDGRVRDSYWQNPVGIDQGEPSQARYAFHALIGHHGAFSLSPIWLLSLVGLCMQIYRRGWPLRTLAGGIALLTIVCFAFYIMRPQADRNYGGMSSGLRWTFWLIPLWLLAMLPAVDTFSERRWFRVVAAVLLAISVVSISYPTWNPWVHPWLTHWLLYENWIQF